MILASVPALALWSCAAPGPVALFDLEGARHTPLDVEAGHLHVLVFVVADCPIANAYAPTLQALRADLAAAPVRFYLVHVEPGLTDAAGRAHARAYGLADPIVVDRGHDLVRAVGATMTPEVALLGPGRTLLYRGRIDNWFGDLGKKRPQPTRHDLRDAIAAALAGEVIAEPRTTAVGCTIE